MSVEELFCIDIKRQFDGEGGSFALDAFDTDTAMVLFNDLSANAEPQTATAMSVLIGFLGRIEGLKDKAKLIWGDADAGVGNQNLHHLRLLIFPDFDSNSSASRHCLPSIDQQV